MMKKILPAFLLVILFLTSCSLIKTIRLLSQGKVEPKSFKCIIPFEHRLGFIILKVKIHEVEYDFLLDSGAPLAVSEELAAKLDLPTVNSQMVMDSKGNKSKMKMTVLDEITIGNVSFLNTGALIAKLSDPGLNCLKVSGIVGANLMKRATWQIDFENQFITITSSPDSLMIPDNSRVISFTPAVSGTPVVSLNINGVKENMVIFDIGAMGDIRLSERTFQRLKRRSSRFNYVSDYGYNGLGLFGAGEMDSTYYVKVPSIKMGGFSSDTTVVEFSKKTLNTIGLQFMSKYLVTLNWQKKKIILSPNEHYGRDSLYTTGMTFLYKDGKLFIGSIMKGSSASKAGLNLDDQIISLNGQDVSTLEQDDWCIIFQQAVDGMFKANLDLIVKDTTGKEIKTTLIPTPYLKD
ncbi:MAG: aspartyl protease family protein [Bacteroidetes bacterium]|nr:aspartyl protease family protein [Bacteroidota bacterium]